MKIFLPGGAGLVGLNLIQLLQKYHPTWEIIVVDKRITAIKIGKRLFPKVEFICEDLYYTKNNIWPRKISGCDACVMLQAEIGNKNIQSFNRNNVESTKIIIRELIKNKIIRLIHISSSVVNSVSSDHYTLSKKEQEKVVLDNWINPVILRPTLMFGWFDRKHLGWLARLMKKAPIFPIPGSGNFIRQPLYVGDFCKLIERCLVDNNYKGIFEVTGLEKVSYINLIKSIKRSVKSNILIIHIPIFIFGFLLKIWGLISKKPAFTNSQLKALTAGDQFPVTDWPRIFKVNPTPLEEALNTTYQHPLLSKVFIPFH